MNLEELLQPESDRRRCQLALRSCHSGPDALISPSFSAAAAAVSPRTPIHPGSPRRVQGLQQRLSSSPPPRTRCNRTGWANSVAPHSLRPHPERPRLRGTLREHSPGALPIELCSVARTPGCSSEHAPPREARSFCVQVGFVVDGVTVMLRLGASLFGQAYSTEHWHHFAGSFSLA